MSNFGSKRPLNWNPANLPESNLEKSLTHEEKLAAHLRKGAPPTNPGSFYGVKSVLTPAIPQELNPPLVLEKALLVPIKTGPGGKKELPRKRDEHGKFAEAQQTGTQSAAVDDAAENEREARGAATKIQNGVRKGGNLPGMTDSSLMANNPVTQNKPPIGLSLSGGLIHDDPYHPDHGAFTPEDHMQAGNLHDQNAQASSSTGDLAGAAEHQQKAAIHRQLAEDKKSPMERFSNNMAKDPNKQAVKSLNPFDWFFQQQHANQPGFNTPNMNGVQPPMGGTPTDQNKPNLGNMTGQGPSPGMINTQTGTGMGPQTSPPNNPSFNSQFGVGPQSDLANQTLPDNAGVVPPPMDPMTGGQMAQMASPPMPMPGSPPGPPNPMGMGMQNPMGMQQGMSPPDQQMSQPPAMGADPQQSPSMEQPGDDPGMTGQDEGQSFDDMIGKVDATPYNDAGENDEDQEGVDASSEEDPQDDTQSVNGSTSGDKAPHKDENKASFGGSATEEKSDEDTNAAFKSLDKWLRSKRAK